MSLKPDHTAADLRALMNQFATAAESATPAAQANRIRQQLQEARPDVAEGINEDLSPEIKKLNKTYKKLFSIIAYDKNGKKLMSKPKAHKEVSRQLGVDPDDMDEYLRLEYYDFFDTVNKEWEKQKGNRKEHYSNEIYGKVDADPTKIKEARPDVMRHAGDKTIRVVKRGGKPIGEIGTDSEASEGNGAYYVKLYDGSYDAVGFDSAEEALAELKAAIKQGVAEAGHGDANRLEHRGAEYNVYFNTGKGMYTARGTGQMKGQIAPQWFRTLADAQEHAEMEIGGYDDKGVAEGSLTEFAPSDSGGGGDDDGFDEDTLRKLAAQWFAGDEDPQVERLLAAAGWEIGQDEGYDDEPGVFVVMSGDDDGRSYISWPAEELRSAMSEGVTEAGAEDNEGNPVVSAILRRILHNPRHSVIERYGARAVMDAVKEVADFVGDVEEIGSSDVSGWVRHVEQMLGNMEPGVTEQQVDELSPKTLGSYIKKSSADAAERQGEVSGRNQFGKGAEFAVKAFYGDQIQPNPTRTDSRIAKRQAGIDQAVDRLTAEDVAESRDPIEQLRADIRRFSR